MKGMCVLIISLLFLFSAVQGQVKTQVMYSGNIKNETELLHFLSLGIHNFEMDVMPIYGELYVTSTMPDSANHTKPTFNKAYLLPFFNQFKKNGNAILSGNNSESYLVLNIVFGAPQSYKILRDQLAPVHDMLTYKSDGNWHLGKVQLVVKDKGLKSRINKANLVLEGVVGTPGDVDSTFEKHTMPFIETDFQKLTSWNGYGTIPFEDYLAIKNKVSEIQKKGEKICLSGCPNSDDAWDILIKSGVDFISTVNAIELQTFINKQKAKE